MNTLRRLPLALCLASAGCMVGPDFERPAAPDVDRYTPGPAAAGPNAPKLDPNRPVAADWWTVFGSAEIDGLVVRALGEDFIERNILPNTQLRRLIRPEEIAHAIVFLIRNPTVSGQLWADAGWRPVV